MGALRLCDGGLGQVLYGEKTNKVLALSSQGIQNASNNNTLDNEEYKKVRYIVLE